MKNTSVSLIALVSLFVSGAAWNANAHEVVKADRQACAMVEPFNEVRSPDGSVPPSVPIVPNSGDEESGERLCMIIAKTTCGGQEIIVEAIAERCADAGKLVDDILDSADEICDRLNEILDAIKGSS